MTTKPAATSDPFSGSNEDAATIHQSQALTELLIRHFGLDELRHFAHRLHIDHEKLPYKTKVDLARELVIYCKRRGRLGELEERIREERPLA